jgi:hypothetical protein
MHAPLPAWGLEIQIKQPHAFAQFAIEAPFLTPWGQWLDFFDGKSDKIELHESGPREISKRGDDLVFTVHPARLVWSVSGRAILSALGSALHGAVQSGLKFIDDNNADEGAEGDEGDDGDDEGDAETDGVADENDESDEKEGAYLSGGWIPCGSNANESNADLDANIAAHYAAFWSAVYNYELHGTTDLVEPIMALERLEPRLRQQVVSGTMAAYRTQTYEQPIEDQYELLEPFTAQTTACAHYNTTGGCHECHPDSE